MSEIVIGETVLSGQRYSLRLDDYRTTGLRVGVLGSSGSGKGWLTGVIIEDFIAAGLPVIMLDAEHELWTFKELGALVVGGSEGDAPFVEDTTAIDDVIRWAIRTATPVVFDVSEIAESEESEAARLGELVMRRLWGIVDRERRAVAFACTEAAIFAPQTVTKGAPMPAMLRQFMSRGRKRGLISVFETQRMAEIQKSVISQTNVAFYGRTDKSVDFNAVKSELDGRQYEEQRTLEVGTFYVTPDGVEVRVRARRVTHGGGGPDRGPIEIREADRGGLDEVLAALRSAAEHVTDADVTASAKESVERNRRNAKPGHEYVTPETFAAMRKRAEDAERDRDSARQTAENARQAAARYAEQVSELSGHVASADALRSALAAFIGSAAPSTVSLDGVDVPALVSREVARLLSERGVASGPALMPTEVIRERYLEAAAQRLVERIRALDEDERETLLFLLAHPDGVTATGISKALTGNDGGTNVKRYAGAANRLVSAGLAKVLGRNRDRRQPSVDEWVRSGLSAHEPTDADIVRVRDRALGVLMHDAV